MVETDKYIYMHRKGRQTMISGYRTMKKIEDIYNDNNNKNKTLNNGLNLVKLDMKNIQHTYNLHISVLMKFQSHGR